MSAATHPLPRQLLILGAVCACSSYRLCPAGEELSEACFQSHPLEFVPEKHALVFQNGSRLPIKGVFTNVGTSPAGSVWARLPIPTGWAEWMPPDTRGLGPRCSCDESGDGGAGLQLAAAQVGSLPPHVVCVGAHLSSIRGLWPSLSSESCNSYS